MALKHAGWIAWDAAGAMPSLVNWLSMAHIVSSIMSMSCTTRLYSISQTDQASGDSARKIDCMSSEPNSYVFWRIGSGTSWNATCDEQNITDIESYRITPGKPLKSLGCSSIPE